MVPASSIESTHRPRRSEAPGIAALGNVSQRPGSGLCAALRPRARGARRPTSTPSTPSSTDAASSTLPCTTRNRSWPTDNLLGGTCESGNDVPLRKCLPNQVFPRSTGCSEYGYSHVSTSDVAMHAGRLQPLAVGELTTFACTRLSAGDCFLLEPPYTENGLQ